MATKLKIELTIKIEEEDFKVSELRDIVKGYLKEGKFMLNDIGFKKDYREE